MKAFGIFASVVLPVTYILLGPVFARADTTFDVAGTYAAPSAGTFSGTLTVNTQSGVLDSVNITLGAYPVFTSISNSEPSSDNTWGISTSNNNALTLFMKVDTTPNAVSLAGLTSGSIVDGAVLESLPTGVRPMYTKLGGSINPVLSAPSVPEPSSVALLAIGFLACLTFGLWKGTLNRQG